MKQKPLVLAIDDEQAHNEMIALLLQPEFRVITTDDALAGQKLAIRKKPDVILLDLKMPKMDGLELCSRLRTDPRTEHIPILMVTAYNDLELRTKAFIAGADDFISKPYSRDEIVARINSKLRRQAEHKERARRSQPKALEIDMDSKDILVKGQAVKTTPTQFKMIQLLLAKKEKIVSRKQITTKVWGATKINPRTIDAFMVTIRKLIQHSGLTIESRYSEGYILREK